MDFEDKFIAKGVQSLSSSVQSTPEKNGNSDDASGSPELLQEFLKSGSKKELLRACFDKEKKQSGSSKSKTGQLKSCSKVTKKQDSKKGMSAPFNVAAKKQLRKSENPTRLVNNSENLQDNLLADSWICKNSACRAVLPLGDAFCKRCSCCICHLFDDNKDPSLWLVCTSDKGEVDSCGLSCHIECALQKEKVGVVDFGQFMQLDGSYCCASCGKVSGILSCWKKQLVIAKDARRLDILCYRIYLCFRLLDGTSRSKEIHDIVNKAKAKLETEVGPVNGLSAKMARGLVSRLSVAGEVQKLCSLAIEKADDMLSAMEKDNHGNSQDSQPAACKFFFENVTSSSVSIILIELSSPSSMEIKGYKLWYCKSKDERLSKEPTCVFPKSQKRILISNLLPCTEYTFGIVSYTENGDLGRSESTCFTKSKEILKHSKFSAASRCDIKKDEQPKSAMDASGFKVRDLGKILRFAWAQEEGCMEGLCSADLGKCCAITNPVLPETKPDPPPTVSRQLDLNVASVPDLNEELVPPFDLAPGDGFLRSCGSNDSQRWKRDSLEEIPAVDSLSRKRSGDGALEEIHDCDSTLINGSPFRASCGSGSLDENFEYCVKIIRWLECQGHIDQEFRLKLLTWFSLRSTEQERRVVNTFIQTLIDDPVSLAGQLVDSFTDMISNKRQRNGFCSKLWH